MVLSFENDAHWRSYRQYSFPIIRIEDYDVIIDGTNFFYQPVKTDQRTYNYIWKITTSQRDDYITSCLLHYVYFKN